MMILAWVIGIFAVGAAIALAAACKVSSLCSRAEDEEWEAALRRAREAEATGKKELEQEKKKMLEELRK